MNRYAILIGSSRFDKEPKLKPLRCPENDVDGMHEIIAAQELGAFTEAIILKNTDHRTVIDQLEDTLNAGTNEDQFLIYYSGHGLTDLPGRLYLTTTNTQERKLFGSSLPVESLRTMIEISGRKKIMLILDCCFAGAAGKTFANVKSSIDEQLKDLSRGNGIYLLTASTANTTALEKESDEYSLLTKHIIHGIKSGEAARAGTTHISIEDVYNYVYRQVTAEGQQEPMRWALNVRGEELIIARAAKAQAERLRQLEDQVLGGWVRRLPRKVRIHAQQIIDECQAQPGLHLNYLCLLEDIFEGKLEVGEFLDAWETLSITEQRRRPTSVPKDEPILKTQARNEEELEALTRQLRDSTERLQAAIKEELPNRLTERINGASLEMILVPAGKFTMGGTSYSDEQPPHEVTVPGFYIGKYQITQAQWKAVMGDELKPHFKGDDLPMECVSWMDAQEFCQKLSQMTNNEYRLPSEAEWEYACRAGTRGDYAGTLDEMAWYHKNSDGKTHPVGKKKANAFGVFDMHGNVWEWCEDVWHDNYQVAPKDGSAWTVGGNSDRRLLRGGSWILSGILCRSAHRYDVAPGARNANIGFRVVVAARTP